MPDEPQIPKKWPDGQKSTPAEKWAWDEIQAGHVADFNERYNYKEPLDAKKPEGWNIKKEDRRLSAAFLVAILTDKGFQNATPHQGVRIFGALFDEVIDLQHAQLAKALRLERSWFKEELKLFDLHIEGVFSFAHSRFSGPVNLIMAVFERSLFLVGAKIEKGLDMAHAQIKGQANMEGGKFQGKLDMNSVEIERHLLMRNESTFQEVDLTAARIDGYLDTQRSTFKGTEDRTFEGTLKMNGLEVGGSFLMGTGATFQKVELTNAKIGGVLDMDGGRFEGTLSLDSTEIGRGLYARSARFPKGQKVNLRIAKIGSTLDISGSRILAFDLTGTTIVGELRLGSAAKGQEPPKWVGDSRMNLRNATVGAMQDAGRDSKSWPKRLELGGFKCGLLGGYGVGDEADMASRSSEWFIKWLGRDSTSSPQPYQMIARLLREAGFPSKANDVLYAGRERARVIALENARENPSGWWRWIGMSLLNWSFGYGLGWRYFWALGWVFVFMAVGIAILWFNLPELDRDFLTLLGASLDRLLPFVELDKSYMEFFEQISLPVWAWGYFYFHKLVGYILASFLIAGLAGLTQKS